MRVEKTYSVTIPRPEDQDKYLSMKSTRRRRNSGASSTFSSNTTKGWFSSSESRKNLAFIINAILLVSSLILIGTGGSLMGFYRVHMLEIITPEFLIVPTVLTGGGIFTLIISLFGLSAHGKEDSCWIIVYAFLQAIDFFILATGIISSVRLLFDIQIGFLDADVITELATYETNSWVKYKWDTIQREFTCCGGYGYTQGYTDWKHTTLGGSKNSVPDSCCLFETPGCGNAMFQMNDIRVVVGKINVHGCLTVMQRRLETHVSVILIVYGVVGGILAVLQLLGIVIACCLITNYSQEDDYTVNDYGRRFSIPDQQESCVQSNGAETTF